MLHVHTQRLLAAAQTPVQLRRELRKYVQPLLKRSFALRRYHLKERLGGLHPLRLEALELQGQVLQLLFGWRDVSGFSLLRELRALRCADALRLLGECS